MSERKIETNRGFIVVAVALLLVVILGFVALATDAGVVYSSRTAAQEIVDGAALAGASTFVLNPTAPQPATAIAYATNAAANQSILGNAVDPADVTVTVANRIVTVHLTHTEPTFFAKVLGVNSADVAVQARAEASDTALGASCVKPFFLPNAAFLPAGANVCNACDPAKPEYNQVLFRGGAPTAYAFSKIGQQFNIRPLTPNQALEPAQYYSLALGGRGGDDYRTNIGTCVEGAIYCGECFGVEPGNMVGPTKQGVEDLIGNPADIFHAVGDYGPLHSDTSRSLVVVPVWDVCFNSSSCGATPFCPAGKFDTHGRNPEIQIVGFALLFIDGTSGNNVQAHLINLFSCGSGGGGPGEIGPYSVPIRLVRPAG